MKKILFCLLVIVTAFTCKAQDLDYNTYPPEHVDDYILPSALQPGGGCFYSVFDTLNLYSKCFIMGGFLNGIYTIAVPYYSDTLVSIYGISVLGNKDSENQPAVHLQIRDSMLDNVLASKEANFPNIEILPFNYTEVFFDTPVTIQGLYHVVVEFGTHEASEYRIGLLNAVLWVESIEEYANNCGRGCHSDYSPLYRQRGDSTWYTFPQLQEVGIFFNAIDDYYAIPFLFPIRGELVPPVDTAVTDTASSALWTGVLNDESVRVYPNPADEVLNVASDYNILNVAIFDAVNRLVEEKEVNAKSVRISLAERPSGVYFINVRTDRGSTMRKVIVR